MFLRYTYFCTQKFFTSKVSEEKNLQKRLTKNGTKSLLPIFVEHDRWGIPRVSCYPHGETHGSAFQRIEISKLFCGDDLEDFSGDPEAPGTLRIPKIRTHSYASYVILMGVVWVAGGSTYLGVSGISKESWNYSRCVGSNLMQIYGNCSGISQKISAFCLGLVFFDDHCFRFLNNLATPVRGKLG